MLIVLNLVFKASQGEDFLNIIVTIVSQGFHSKISILYTTLLAVKIYFWNGVSKLQITLP